jgi:DNA-binding PucR family transcriptional regulator
VAIRTSKSLVRYGDVVLQAALLRDELLASSLQSLYLTPLEEERGGGEVLRQTLRAYFAAERHVSSAAAALRVDRHTVARRLSAVEDRLGRPLGHCLSELEAALRLEDMQKRTRTEPPVAVPAEGSRERAKLAKRSCRITPEW